MRMYITESDITYIRWAKSQLEMGDFSVCVIDNKVCFYKKEYPETIVCHYTKSDDSIWRYFSDIPDGIEQSELFRIVYFMGDVTSTGLTIDELKDVLEWCSDRK